MKAQWLVPLIAAALVGAGVWAWLELRPPAAHPQSAAYAQRQAGIVLVGAYTSYQSVEQVSARLAAEHAEFVRRTLARPPDARYPPRTIDTLVVAAVPMLGTQGKLSLQFFNDRLFEVDFKPDDAAACAQALTRGDAQLHRDANGRAERSAGAWRVATNAEFAASKVGASLHTEPYVVWQDLRLVGERDDWDARFGALPFGP